MNRNLKVLLNRIFQIDNFADIEELTFPMDAPTWDEQTEWLDKFLKHMRDHTEGILEEVMLELVEADAWAEYWRQEALRQYPTPEAYDSVCKARDKWQQRAEQAEQSAIRPEVRWFAEEMEMELRKHEHKGGWIGTHMDFLKGKLLNKVECLDMPEGSVPNGWSAVLL